MYFKKSKLVYFLRNLRALYSALFSFRLEKKAAIDMASTA